MLVIVAILLIFGAVVRHKWKNAAAKKEEILRLLAAASHEEAEIAKLQGVDVYESPPPPPPPPQIQNQYFCAVCYCPTTTRCSQCKSVRYCSGKCQIIHWRQGHKDECRPASSLQVSKESACAVKTALLEQFEINCNNEAEICSDPTEQLDDSGSSSSSLPCFSSSAEHSETSFDASSSENFESGTPIGPDKVASGGIDYHMSQSTSDSDEADVSSVSPLHPTTQAVNNKIGVTEIKKSQSTKPDDGFRKTSTEDKRTGDGAALSKDCVGTTELRSSKSYGSPKTSSSVENHTNQTHLPSDKVTKSMYSRRSGSHQQVPNVDTKNSPCLKSSSTTSLDFWGNEAQLCRSTETRSLSFRSPENDERMSSKTGSGHSLLSELEDAQTLLQPTSKALKTSMRKFVDHFKVSKQSKSYTFDVGKDSAGNYNHKIIFSPKLFMQLYSCDGVELHPVGLMNCGNSCYANAVLQCLMFTRPIAAYLLQGLHSKTCRKRDWCLICEFESLIRKGQEMKSPLSPVGILSHIQRIGSHLSHGREEDAHDFLRNVIDSMQSIWLEEAHVSGSLAEDSTLLGLTFGGHLRSKIKCMKCSGRSVQYDRMMDLTVEIDGDINTLEQALAQFTISETLAGEDKYKCSRCMSYVKAKKKLTVIEAPNILTIVLKRFRSGNLGKLNKLVRFPEVLNLARYMSGMSDKYPIYDLYAVVVHLNMTNAAYSGHYISYVKDIKGEWFRIDDSRVSHVDLETVLSAEAYILFYARRTPRGPSLLTNSSMYSDGKSRRNLEAISSSANAKKKNSKPSSGYAESSMLLHQESERQSYKMHPREIRGSHAAEDYEDWGPVCKNPILDSSSDCSSIFSVSDAGSCSTDSTKESNAEDKMEEAGIECNGRTSRFSKGARTWI
ncbi:ubiquitin-specific protease 17 [Perilla frutescens var. hirtella]|uniref:ubiquitinyl hydrolase 1 n=1 Tax=Perilla frutescens var. hirtella TaxID=608512 RepID=A0AAD4P1R4_PERFH|nr:ubiquitin-specific protease 17 [Perilla frutescens var. hirtella]